jgi:amidase
MPALLQRSDWTTHNPWLRGFNAGGSSSGPGALVAAGLLRQDSSHDLGETVDMALCGDQGGSIRLPLLAVASTA